MLPYKDWLHIKHTVKKLEGFVYLQLLQQAVSCGTHPLTQQSHVSGIGDISPWNLPGPKIRIWALEKRESIRETTEKLVYIYIYA